MTSDMLPRGQRHSTAFLMASLALVVMQTFRASHQWSILWLSVDTAVALAAGLGLLWYVRTREHGRGGLPPRRGVQTSGLVTLLVASSFLPLVTQRVGRSFGIGDATEIVLMLCVQQGALAAAAAPWPRAWQAAILLSSFLVLFVASACDQPLVLIGAGIYAMVGLWCLMGNYWDRLAGGLAVRSERRLPRRGVVWVAALLVVSLGLAFGVLWGAGSTPRVLAGFLPSSGGEQGGDPYARSGVGDGDQLIAAQDHASSFGPVESDLFLTSNEPSLYDTFTNTYGEPVRQREQHRAISLDAELGRDSHEKMADSAGRGREFSAVRRGGRPRHRDLEDRRSDALFFLVGRTPLHLRLETYDHFDGRTWSHTVDRPAEGQVQVETVEGKPWMRWVRPDRGALLGGKQTHAVKFVQLRSRRIPAPAQLAAWHIDRVDQPSFFAVTPDECVELAGQPQVPRWTVVHLISQTSRLQGLAALGDRPAPLAARPYLQLPSDAHRATAAAWAGDAPQGVRQVERVIARLRSEFDHDHQAVAPEDCEDVVSHFLVQRRGPDYLFASAAAVLLRSLGYATRVVSGFYAHRDGYDPRARHTVVAPADVHFWVEWCVDGSHWLPLEPTPGYQQPTELRTFWQRVAGAAVAIGTWSARHPGTVAALATCAVAVRVGRDHLVNGLTWLLWCGGFHGSLRRRVRWTLRLLEWRAHLAGRARPRTQTLAAWHAQHLTQLTADAARPLRTLLELGDWSLYGLADPRPNRPDDEVRAVCRAVARRCTVRRLRRRPKRARGRRPWGIASLNSWLGRARHARTARDEPTHVA
ncbi:MAG: transglutaminase-like domain-containing protein [Pirellulaceae bacterium]|nr:transglutaminase-like domain-containing protein [Pirellulaceae bacterium]